MITVIDKSKCCGCEACVQICPRECIEMEYDIEGFKYPVIDQSKCISCGMCNKVCPFELKYNTEKKEFDTFACYLKDNEVRKNSSSGGIFSLIANQIIDEGGIVFGVAMSYDCRRAEYYMAANKEQLIKLRGSKYIQSNVNGAYSKVEKELKKNKKVLFTGTPCQINALKSFLKKDYENLLCADVICHGVPSPKLWEKYIEYVENKISDKIVEVNFRCKDKNWKGYGLKKITFKGKEILKSKETDSYLQMFLKNYCLRPSCYECNSKEYRLSDITLGDFWGIENICEQMNDGKGVSLVITRSYKGKEFFNLLKDKIVCNQVMYSEAIKYNPSEIKSVKRTKAREKFFVDMNNKNFHELEILYLYPTTKLKLKKILIDLGVMDKINNIKELFQ